MEVDAIEFLNRFSSDELKGKGVLRGNTQVLNNASVFPLIDLMVAQEVTRLVAPERDWFLTSEGEYSNPLSTESKTGNVQDLGNRGNVFNEQNTSINPHYIRRPSPPDSEGDEEASDELRFGLERDLQKALRANIQQLESGLEIIDGDAEKSVEAGRIDITAEDASGCLVVIELKAGKAELRSIGQLLSYMGSENSQEPSRPVRGILVASDFDDRVVLAAKAVPNISLRAYSFQFLFSQR